MKEINNLRENKLKSRKGAVSLLVAITIFTFIAILMGAYLTVTILRESQYDSNEKIRKVYEADVDKVDEIYSDLEEVILEEGYDKLKGVNKPELLTGMTPIKFTMPTEGTIGETVRTTKDDKDWYEYGTTYQTKRWANVETKDGSMWVWIPRFAYRTNTEEQTTEVVFLIGVTDKYYDENGKLRTAKRCTKEDEVADTTVGFTVHPAFTNESSINYRNGGWDKELTGIWVAKFEAGYASGNNDSQAVASNVSYSQTTSWVRGVERTRNSDGTVQSDGWETARNWLDGIYGETTTAIKYPVFRGTTYSMNYINHNDAYNISKALTDSGNIYGFSSSNADSHLMKNSEWGAVTYLSRSKYGLYDTDITINNANLNSGGSARTETSGKSGVNSVYAVTGCTSNTTNTGENVTTISAINSVTANTPNAQGIYAWNQKTGQNASSSGTIYGIYDLSGGMWEITSGLVSNGHKNLLIYGKSLLDETKVTYTISGNTKIITANTGKSTKYVSIYPSDDSGVTDINTASTKNYDKNKLIYGDSIRETSTAGTGSTSWNGDVSYFFGYNSTFLVRGGSLWFDISTGLSSFYRRGGYSYFENGFRAVLVAI